MLALCRIIFVSLPGKRKFLQLRWNSTESHDPPDFLVAFVKAMTRAASFLGHPKIGRAVWPGL